MAQERIVDKRGRLQLGRALAGRQFEVSSLPDGDILLRALPEIPENERWLHTPEMKAKLQRAMEWMRTHPPEETDLDQLEATYNAMAADRARRRQGPKSGKKGRSGWCQGNVKHQAASDM